MNKADDEDKGFDDTMAVSRNIVYVPMTSMSRSKDKDLCESRSTLDFRPDSIPTGIDSCQVGFSVGGFIFSHNSACFR